MGTGGSMCIKWPGHEAAYTSPSSDEIKNVCSYTSTPQVHKLKVFRKIPVGSLKDEVDSFGYYIARNFII